MFSNVDDEELFTPAAASNLASLFGTSMNFKQGSDASLTYTAPKQPKTSGQETPKSSPKPAPQSSIVCSKFVDVFQLMDRSHVAQGKCGLAIIGSHSLKAYEIIIYKSKQDIITRSKLKPDLIFTVQSNNFIHFCDEQKQQWSVHFENTKECDNFVKNIETHGGKVVCNSKNVDISDIPKSSPSETKPKPEEDRLNELSSTVKRDKDSDSLSDNSSHAKASILSRMAKMGQSILPTNVSKQSSDRSDSETDEQKVNRKPVKKRQKFVNGEHVSTDKVNHSQALNTQVAPAPEFVMVNGQIIPASTIKQSLPPTFPSALQGQFVQNMPSQMIFSQPQVSPMSDSLHIFIAENRTHNCELRMNMTQLSSKLDQVLANLHTNGNTASSETSDRNAFEFAGKVKELEECQKTITDFQEQQTKLEEAAVNDKNIIGELRQENENQKKIISGQAQRIQELEQLAMLMDQQTATNKALQQNMEEQQQTIIDLKQTIDNQKVNIQKLENSVTDELNESIRYLKSQLTDKNAKGDLFARKLKQSMNSLYQQIMENFEDETIAFPSEQIKQILTQKLKTATFTIIQEFENNFRDSEPLPQTDNSNLISSVPQCE